MAIYRVKFWTHTKVKLQTLTPFKSNNGINYEYNKESIFSVKDAKHMKKCRRVSNKSGRAFGKYVDQNEIKYICSLILLNTYHSKSTVQEFILNHIRIAVTVVVSNCINSSLSNSIYLRSFRLVLKRMVISFCSRNRLNIWPHTAQRL